jgi:acetolactate synthase I/II/III large subunit
MDSAELSAAIAEALAEAGADLVFGVPGGGNNLDLIGAVETAGLRFVLAHAETAASVMAAVYADLTDAPAGCLVTRGPGVASVVNGVANAMLDRQQLVLVADAVGARDRERITHQQVDQRALLAPVTKWSATAGSGAAHRTVRHAVQTAMTAPRGPVHLDFDPSACSTPPPTHVAVAEPPCSDLARAAHLLRRSRRPVVLLGVGARPWTAEVRDLLQVSAAPVLMTYRAKGVVPDSSPSAAGTLTGATAEAPLLEASDLIVMIGVDTVELIPAPWPYRAPVLSIGAWPEPSRYLACEVELVGDLASLIPRLASSWPDTTWDEAAGNTHRDHEIRRMLAAGPPATDGISPQTVVTVLRALAPPGSIATVDAGAHMLPAMSLWSVEEPDEILISSGLATMGFALPAAVGAALARPGRRVVCFTGDGGLGISLAELETLNRLQLPVTVVVFNDARLSLIAVKAKAENNGGANAVTYSSTDFAQVARGFGLVGERATTRAELETAVAASLRRAGPTLVDVRIDPNGYAEIIEVVRGGGRICLHGQRGR